MLKSYNGEQLNSELVPWKSYHQLLKHVEKIERKFLTVCDENKITAELTFSEFARKVNSFSGYLLKKLDPDFDSNIAVVMDNTLEGLIAYSAAMNLGFGLVPLDTKANIEFYKKAKEVFDCEVVIADADHPVNSVFVQQIQYSSEEVLLDKDYKPREGTVILCSSGTTGVPKGVVHNFAALMVHNSMITKTFPADEFTRQFAMNPLAHVSGLEISYLRCLSSQSELIFWKNFNIIHFWEILRKTKPTIVNVLPGLVKLLVDDPREEKFPASVKYIHCGGSYLGRETVAMFYKKFGFVVHHAYGCSETVSMTNVIPATLSTEEYFAILSLDPSVTVGTEIPGTNVFLLDETGEVITEELKEGEIAIRSHCIFNGYYKNEAATREVIRNSYFVPGDIGYFRNFKGQRYYFVSGRKKEIVRVNSYSVNLNDIDDLVMSITGITACCSVSYTDAFNEEHLGIFLVMEKETSVSEIRKELRKVMPPYCKLGKIIIGKEVMVTNIGKKKRQDMSIKYFKEEQE